jgi:hypothetical protein
VTTVPFPTALVAEYLGHQGQYLAAAIYNGTFVVIAVFFNVLWRSASAHNRLIHPAADSRAVQAVTDSYRWGPMLYVAAFVLAFVNVTASLGLNLGLAVYFALPSRPRA